MNYSEEQIKARAILLKLKPLFDGDRCAALIFAILRQALTDASSDPLDKELSPCDRRSAIDYLNGDLSDCDIAGVDPSYVKMVIGKVGLNLN